MTATVATRRRSWVWLVLAGAVFAVAVLVGSPPADRPLDPTANGPSGTKGLMNLLEDFGGTARVDDEVGTETDVVVLLQDVGSRVQHEQVREWVRDGGTLVVADPFSPFTPVVSAPIETLGGLSTAPPMAPGSCDIDALAGIDAIDPVAGSFYDVSESADSCFMSTDGDAYVTADREGDGVIVAIGGAFMFTNEWLDSEDNAVVAVNLMAPTSSTDIVYLRGDTADAPATSPFDLLGPGMRGAFWQLGVVFLLVALWRGRRLGSPISEPQPVDIAGSELVAAVGRLLEQSKSPDRAAALIQRDLRRSFAERLGLPTEETPEVVADAVSVRTGCDRDRVLEAISPRSITDETELVSLAQLVESVRQEVIHGRRP